MSADALGARAHDGEEVALPAGDVTEGVVRVGTTVRRPHQPHSEAVAAYLAHLATAGFDGAPQWHGLDGRGRDILDYIEGDVPGSPVESWATTDAILAQVAELLRRLHDASMGFVSPPGARWFADQVVVDGPDEVMRLFETPELVSHNDVTPQNVVFRGGRPVAVIDFDLAGPTTRLLDVLNTAMHWVPLAHPADRAPVYAYVDVPARLRLFVDAYGLCTEERARLLDLADRAWLRSWHRMRANAEHRGGGWARMWSEGVGEKIQRRREWLRSDRALLDRALA